MKLNRVLIVYKKLEPVSHPTEPASRRKRHRRKTHDATLATVVRTAKRMGIIVRTLERSRFTAGAKADLIMTVGGDGTVLTAAHHAGSTPILGVNSRPGKSVGFYCAATKATFPKLLRRIITDTWKPLRLPVLVAAIDGRPLPFRALNDILFASHRPFDLVSYRLTAGKRSEWQRGSGLWICAGPGSSAGHASAGGKKVNICSAQPRFLVREPCPFPGRRYRLLRGTLRHGESIAIVGDGKGGLVCLDGPLVVRSLEAGQKLTVKIAPQQLKIYMNRTI